MKNDNNCILEFSTGAIYKGEIKDGKFNGHGKFIKSDGLYYDGEYLNGLKHGKGILKT